MKPLWWSGISESNRWVKKKYTFLGEVWKGYHFVGLVLPVQFCHPHLLLLVCVCVCVCARGICLSQSAGSHPFWGNREWMRTKYRSISTSRKVKRRGLLSSSPLARDRNQFCLHSYCKKATSHPPYRSPLTPRIAWEFSPACFAPPTTTPPVRGGLSCIQHLPLLRGWVRSSRETPPLLPRSPFRCVMNI